MFDSIVTGDDTTNGKPNPEPYLTSLAQTGTLPEKSVVIEDSKSGIQSALGANCSVLAIATSHTRAELSGSYPTYIADDFQDARRQLR